MEPAAGTNQDRFEQARLRLLHDMLAQQGPQILERQANLRREAMLSQPGLFMDHRTTSGFPAGAPMQSAGPHPQSFQAVPQPQAPAAVATTPAAAPQAFGAHAAAAIQVQGNSGTLAWEHTLASAMQRALKEGLTQGAKNTVAAGAVGLWHCPVCEIDVDMYNLDTHIDSSKHLRCREQKRHVQMVQQRQQQGEIPEWMEIRDGAEFCKLCQNYATEGHILSSKHQKRVAHLHMYKGIQPLADTAEPPSMTAGAAPAVASMPASPLVLPPGWGNPDFYEWKPETQSLWCKLCFKNADESHVYSMKHQQRASVASTVAGDFVDVSMFGAPPPPPPPPGRPEPTKCVDPWPSQQCQPCNPPWSAANQEVLAIEAPPKQPPLETSVDPWPADLIRQDTLSVPAESESAPSLPQQPSGEQVASAQHSTHDPPQWQAFCDEASGEYYYHCSETGVSQWELPPGESYLVEF